MREATDQLPAARRQRRWAGIGPALAVVAALLPQPLEAAGFLCRGHDPGWELRGGGDGRAAWLPARGTRRDLAGDAADLAAEGVVVWRGRAGGGDPGGDLVAVMLKGACTDPAAGEVSTHSAVVSLPWAAGVVVGCCSYGAGAPGVEASTTAAAPGTEGVPGEDTGTTPVTVVAATPAEVAAPAATSEPAARPLAAGSSARVVGPARERVYVRLDASERAAIAGSVRGGQAVVVGEAADRGDWTWYRVSGKGVPDRAWIRGDLLVGG